MSRDLSPAEGRFQKISGAQDLWLMVCYAKGLHMFGAFSKLFKKSEPAPAPARPTGLQTPPRAASPPSSNETAPKTTVSRPAAAGVAGGDGLVIPYSSIIKLIPQELWGKLAPAGVAGYNYTISRKTVLEQLPHGAVKVSFGELRRGAPSGVFISSTAEDNRLVDLPLSEILDQLHPDAISRRSDQARVEVSADVPDLFGNKGERLAPLRVMEKKEVSNTTSFARQKGSGQTTVTPKPAAAPAPAAPPNNISRLPAQPPAPQAPAAPAPAPAVIRMQPGPAVPPAPAAAPKPAAPIPFPIPKPAAPAAPVAAAPAKALPKLPVAGAPKPPAPVAPAPTAAATPVPLSTGSFFIALDVVAASWPDGVRQELAQLKIPDAKVALPPVDICEGLKRGRIQFPWRTLRSWIQPTPIYATPSPHDDTMLELPLRTLTPLFLDYIRSNPVNRQGADAENITEFFRKAEQATGTVPELLQPLFQPQAPMVAPVVPAAPVAPVAPVAPAPQFFAPAPAAQAVPPGFSPVPAVPASAPVQQGSFTEPSVENDAVCLPISVIANGWPEPVMHDIASFGLAGSRVDIPLASIEPGLKSGRIEFAWRDLCNWLNPPSKPAQVSINGENRLALPLGLVAPLYMKARGAAQARKKTNVADDIPDLFSAAGQPLQQPAPQAAPAPAPVAPAAPVPAQVPAAAPVAKKVPTNLSELFNEPDKKTWTPNEIVQRSTKLQNVAGTLIALQDGLLVASNMPPDFKTDTIAAFVPQIFGRMNQYSKELQMGDIRAVSFTVESGTVQVYNAGIIYFAAIGRGSDLLPFSELQLIASELSRHTK